MTQPLVLTDEDITTQLTTIPLWSLKHGKLHREFRFADFSEAFAFMTRVALAAEKLDHHPEWSNTYATLTVDLLTHDVGGVTELDFELARQMERIFGL
jgi:4a-hydroxytetrahydrobiopterin dehydratase